MRLPKKKETAIPGYWFALRTSNHSRCVSQLLLNEIFNLRLTAACTAWFRWNTGFRRHPPPPSPIKAKTFLSDERHRKWTSCLPGQCFCPNVRENRLFKTLSKTHLVASRHIREFKLHVYGKRQTSDSSWQFLKIENEQIKTAQKNSYG